VGVGPGGGWAGGGGGGGERVFTLCGAWGGGGVRRVGVGGSCAKMCVKGWERNAVKKRGSPGGSCSRGE